MQVEGHRVLQQCNMAASGEWVSNTYPTFPLHGNSLPKGRLMPGVPRVPHEAFGIGITSVADGDASD